WCCLPMRLRKEFHCIGLFLVARFQNSSDVNSRLSQLECNDDIGGQVDGTAIAGSGPEFDLLGFMRSLLIQAMPQPADYMLHHHLTVSHESYAQDDIALHP